MNFKIEVEKFLSKIKNKKFFVMGLLALLVAVGSIGFVAAKYISNYQQEAEIHASNFHFSSNYLEYGSEAEFTVSDWGDHAITFLLHNYEKENTALIADTAITYSINVDPDWTVSVVDAAGKTVTDSNGTYTMAASAAASSHSVTLTYNGDGEPTVVHVSVKAQSPYSKELKARFNLSTKKGIEYTVEDKGDYNILTLYTNNYYGQVLVEWGDTHSPDNTCDYMGAWRDGTSGTLDAKEYTTYTLIFFENAAGTYNKASFTVREGA